MIRRPASSSAFLAIREVGTVVLAVGNRESGSRPAALIARVASPRSRFQCAPVLTEAIRFSNFGAFQNTTLSNVPACDDMDSPSCSPVALV